MSSNWYSVHTTCSAQLYGTCFKYKYIYSLNCWLTTCTKIEQKLVYNQWKITRYDCVMMGSKTTRVVHPPSSLWSIPHVFHFLPLTLTSLPCSLAAWPMSEDRIIMFSCSCLRFEHKHINAYSLRIIIIVAVLILLPLTLGELVVWRQRGLADGASWVPNRKRILVSFRGILQQSAASKLKNHRQPGRA